MDKFRGIVTDAGSICYKLHLDQAHQLAMRILGSLGKGGTLSYRELGPRLEDLRILIENESRSALCLTSYGGVEIYYDQERLFGDAVYKAFPSARIDIQEAGNCIAFDVDTAAVFFLMRAVEWALRAFAVHLGFRQLKTHKKTGKIKLIPVEFAEWERILSEAQDRVDKKIDKMKRGKAKQAAQQFYYPILQDIQGIRDAWRNHVAHVRSSYDREGALAICSHVERLMKTLSTKVAEA
jgi:hypothetical protein